MGIYDFLAANVRGGIILECGANNGDDTVQLAALPGVTVHAFEPDPRLSLPRLPNVIPNRLAVARHCGREKFWPSTERAGQPWTCSGSLLVPSGHLTAYPDVAFGEPIMVNTINLDTYCRLHAIAAVELIWADLQGAEAEMINGARETLYHTRYLYTEYCDPPLYAGQPSLADIMALLPGWAMVEHYPGPAGEAYADVLLENTCRQ